MAWHDETTARRTSGLVRLHDAFDRHPVATRGARRERLRTLIGEHLEVLLDDEFHATGTNHGMFRDRSALIAAAYLDARFAPTPQTDQAWSIAGDRLVEYYRTSISDDGVHLEHAPAYHQVIAAAALRDGEFLTSFGATEAGRVLADAHADMVGCATHVIQPDGTWPLVSDTFRDQSPQVSLWDDPAYRFAATGGQEGTASSMPVAAFEDAGRRDARPLDPRRASDLPALHRRLPHRLPQARR